MNNHQHPAGSITTPFWTRKTGVVLIMFIVIGAFYVVREHFSHVYPYLPYLILFTCPMHPEIKQPGPGNCPKCGMTLEPVIPALDDDDKTELRDFARRFWWSLPLTVIVTVLAMAGHSLQLFHGSVQNWIEFGHSYFSSLLACA